jgi:D-glycerate 3-kinase
MNLFHELLSTETVSDSCRNGLKEKLLVNDLRAKAFGVTSENVNDVIEQRSRILKSVYPIYSNFCQNTLQCLPETMLEILWNLWIPLGIEIFSQHQQLKRPLIQGILGGQGTGKSTLAAMLTIILQQLGVNTASLSLDDLYKTYSDRLALQQQDSRLIWRGPPGTHDIDVGLTLINQIHQSETPISIPRFDKSLHHGGGDRMTPELIDHIDILLLEGWFVGVRPIDDSFFDKPPAPIITRDDKAFARDINSRLNDYVPLWDKLDSLILLYPMDYHLSKVWRKQAEHRMIAAGKSGMTDAQIEDFVDYFWRSLHPELFIKPLLTSSDRVNFVIEINTDHSFGQVYKP